MINFFSDGVLVQGKFVDHAKALHFFASVNLKRFVDRILSFDKLYQNGSSVNW